MKYKVEGLHKDNGKWLGTLVYWKGCACNSNRVEFTIDQQKKPTLNQIKVLVLG